MTDAPLVSRDETHDSIDPHTGTLSPAAQTRRLTIISRLVSFGHTIGGWAEALAHPDFDKAARSAEEPVPAAPEVDPAAQAH